MTIISAMTKDLVIGRDQAIPWHLPSEFAHFKRSTMGGTLIMGRGTWDSMGRRPLPGRTTVLVSRSLEPDEVPDGVTVCRSMDEAVAEARTSGGEIFFAGGASVYEEGLKRADRMLLSFVSGNYEGDTYFPEWDADDWEVVREEPHPDGWVLREYRRSAGS